MLNMTEIRNLLNELNAEDLLALLIYGEAHGEPIEGKIAVAHVVLNRAKRNGHFGKGLVGEGGVMLRPFQFSCFNEAGNQSQLRTLVNLLNKIDPEKSRCHGIAQAVLGGHTKDNTWGATYYHTIVRPKGVNTWPPRWTEELQKTATIGGHVFYRERVEV